MMRRFFSCLMLLSVVLCSVAQKKEIAAAREQVKKGTNLDKAEASMIQLLEDSANRMNEKIWSVLFDAQRKQYDQLNEKLYLAQKYDTTALLNTASRMFQYMEAYDSIDARPDKNGKVKLNFRKVNAAILNNVRPNLFRGGTEYIRK